MLPRPIRLAGHSQRGQALLIAVLLMMAILLVGILFVSIVSFNQQQTERDVDVSGALALARAGVNFADYELQNSPLGADWRPPFKPWTPAYDRNVPSTWPNPPVEIQNGSTGASLEFTPGFYGPDNMPFTDDDYYTEQEVVRGYHGIVKVNNPGTVPGYYARFGYVRYPDPMNAQGNSTSAETFAQNLAVGRGHVLLRVTYRPSPPYNYGDPQYGQVNPVEDPLSKDIKIEAIGVLDENATVVRYVAAHKPLALLSHALFVTDKTNTGRGTKLGFDPWIDMAQDGLAWAKDVTNTPLPPNQQPDFLPLFIYGGVRINGALNLEGVNCDAAKASRDPNDASTTIVLREQPLPVENSGTWFPFGGGYLADDKVIARNQIYEERKTGGFQEQSTAIVKRYNDAGTVAERAPETIWPSDSPNFNTQGGFVEDGLSAADSGGYSRYTSTLSGPDILGTDPQTNLQRYRQLTEQSGGVVYSTYVNQPVNVGKYGAGKGIFIDNTHDLQFVNADGTHDLDLLMEDWLQHIGADSPRAAESGWNATRTLYSPPGVLIDLFPTERATINYKDPTGTTAQGHPLIVTDLTPLATLRSDPEQIWWPGHRSGQPGIRITRTDKDWRIGDPASPNVVGDDSGLRVMYRDYPTTGNQAIYAEGNVRIKGVLPANTRQSAAPRPLDRDYNLTVVSCGTIYVDGQILSIQDYRGRRWGTNDGGGGELDEDTAKIALLAKDCVCLNSSQIVPQLTRGTVAAAADDPANALTSSRHWELTPDGGGGIYTSWMFGAPVVDPVSLVALQTGQDPGPAGIGLSIQRFSRVAGNLVTNDYNFDPGNVSGAPQNTFMFVPSGATINGGFIAPQPWASQVLSPLWEQPAYATGMFPLLPWGLTGGTYLQDGAGGIYTGQSYGLEMRYRDPNLGVPGTSYWLKKFKLAASRIIGGVSVPEPAIRAKVNAVMYAQEGCFFIIPGDYFDTRWNGDLAKHYMRYNYGIEIRGAISENYQARPEAWREWQDKWAIARPDGGWNTIVYRFDESLLAPREQARTAVVNQNVRQADTAFEAVAASDRSNLPKIPLLPVSRDLIYVE